MKHALGTALLALLLAVSAAAASEAPGLDLIILVDRSGSMAATSSSIAGLLDMTLDIVARSADAAHLAHRVAIVSFGSTTRFDLPFTLLHRDDVARLRQRINDEPRHLGATDVLAAFAAADALFATLTPDAARKRAVLILTDGVPYVPRVNPRVYRENLRRFVASSFAPRSITVDTVLLPSRYPRDLALWRALSSNRVHELTDHPGASFAALHRLVTELVGTRGIETEAAARSEQQLVVPPYLELVVFDIFRGLRAVDVTAYAPGVDQPLHAGSEGVEEWRVGRTFATMVIRHPAPGRWTFRKKDDEASVRIFAQEFFPRGSLVLRPAKDAVRQYDRVGLTYRLLDADRKPVQEMPPYPLTVNLSLLKPDGDRDALEMIRDPSLGDAVFRARAATDCDLPGRYWTEVQVGTRDADGRAIDIFRDAWSGFVVMPDAAATTRDAPAPRVPARARMSLAERLGLPPEFVTTLLIMILAAGLAPYFAGAKVGTIELPKILPRKRRAWKIIGPFAAAAAVALVVPLEAFAPAATKLQILAADFTDDGQIDLAVANSGSASALLTRIEIEVVRDYGRSVRPVLGATATYRIPIDALATGQRRGVVTRHLIPTTAAERILIAPETGRVLDVRLHIYASDGTTLSSDVRLWPEQRSPAASPRNAGRPLPRDADQ